jgi:hypothetical protein
VQDNQRSWVVEFDYEGSPQRPQTSTEIATALRVCFFAEIQEWQLVGPNGKSRYRVAIPHERIDSFDHWLKDSTASGVMILKSSSRTGITLVQGFVKFRQDLRQILYENGMRSNPGWTEDDIIRAFRKLLSNVSLRRARMREDLEFHYGSQPFGVWRALAENLIGRALDYRGDEVLDSYKSGLTPEDYVQEVKALEKLEGQIARHKFVSTEAQVVAPEDRWGTCN